MEQLPFYLVITFVLAGNILKFLRESVKAMRYVKTKKIEWSWNKYISDNGLNWCLGLFTSIILIFIVPDFLPKNIKSLSAELIYIMIGYFAIDIWDVIQNKTKKQINDKN